MEKIVCRCMNVTEDEVKDYCKTKEVQVNQMLEDLRIGARCKCCLKDGCPIIDISYESILEEIQKN
jgi:bacterioferritin-associated ferredoxin